MTAEERAVVHYALRYLEWESRHPAEWHLKRGCCGGCHAARCALDTR